MRASDIDRIRALPLFADAAAETFAWRQLALTCSVSPGTMLLLEGDPVDFLYVLLDGQVELHGTWNDHETVLTILRPVSTFIGRRARRAAL